MSMGLSFYTGAQISMNVIKYKDQCGCGFKGVLHPLPNIACFVLYLKIVNFLKKIYASCSKLSKELKKAKIVLKFK